jgi:hypothetical protein
LARVIFVWDILTLFLIICMSTYEVCLNLLIWFNIINTGDNISWIFDFFVLCALCCQFHWIVHFWLPLEVPVPWHFLRKLPTIFGGLYFRIITWQSSRKTTPNEEGIPYLPPGNVWAALWFESCDPSPVPSKSSKIILIANHVSEWNFVWTSILLISEN